MGKNKRIKPLIKKHLNRKHFDYKVFYTERPKHATELAENVVEICKDNQTTFKYLYEDNLSLFKKIEKIAQEIYHASEVVADTKVRQQLKDLEEKGYGKLPVCIAKTQYSFSTDPNLKGAPTGHVLPVREVRLSSGAEFIVVVCGEIMTMPGLPRVPAADSIKLNDKGSSCLGNRNCFSLS